MGKNEQIAISKLHTELKDLKNEDTMLLDIVEVSDTNGDIQIRDCFGCLKINGRDFNDNDMRIETMNSYAPFFPLYLDAKNLAGSNSEGYITALKMSFGISSGKICLLYQPVGLVKVGEKTPNEYVYVARISTNYFTFNASANKFEITYNTTSLTDYKTNLGITHTIGGAWGTLLVDDVTGVIFPFQEIFNVLYYNRQLGDTVSLYNAILKESSEPGARVKHYMLLAPIGVTPPLTASLQGVYADLGHLCPPYCGQLIITQE